MKKITLILIATLFTNTNSCSQTNKNNMIIKQNPDINASNIVEKISSQVKRYPKEPLYQIDFTINHCYPEILVNDMPAYKDFKIGSGGTARMINYNILKAGSQKITLRLYPTIDNKVFLQNSGIEIEIGSYDNTNKYSIEAQEDNLFNYSTPVDKDGLFTEKDKTYYETTQTFTLPNVPYHNIGWSESQDLRQMNKVDLEKKILAYYKEIQEIIKNNDKDMIARISYNKMRDQFVSQYGSKEEIQEAWDEVLEIYSSKDIEFLPIENYELVFYGDGKLVGLQSKKTDKNFRGKSALYMKYKKDGRLVGIDFYYLLHIPTGKTEFEVY